MLPPHQSACKISRGLNTFGILYIPRKASYLSMCLLSHRKRKDCFHVCRSEHIHKDNINVTKIQFFITFSALCLHLFSCLDVLVHKSSHQPFHPIFLFQTVTIHLSPLLLKTFNTESRIQIHIGKVSAYQTVNAFSFHILVRIISKVVTSLQSSVDRWGGV